MQTIDPYGGAEPAYLGKKGVEFDGFDTFDNPGTAIVRMTSDEVTSLCPITGAPDFEVVDITYAPRELCLESKALKLYLQTLRNTAGFVESLACEIADKLARALEPRWVQVAVTQKARGGISIVAVTTLFREEDGKYVSGSPWTNIPRNFYLGY